MECERGEGRWGVTSPLSLLTWCAARIWMDAWNSIHKASFLSAAQRLIRSECKQASGEYYLSPPHKREKLLMVIRERKKEKWWGQRWGMLPSSGRRVYANFHMLRATQRFMRRASPFLFSVWPQGQRNRTPSMKINAAGRIYLTTNCFYVPNVKFLIGRRERNHLKIHF